MTKYIDLTELLLIHKQVIRDSGGMEGIRDIGLVESAIFRPQTTLYGEEMYKTIFDKAAILTISLVKNHGFIDGNKRTALVALVMFMKKNNCFTPARNEYLENLMLDIATDKLSFEKVKESIQQYWENKN